MSVVTTGQRSARRVAHYAYGKPQDVLRVEDAFAPEKLSPGQVRVRVTRSMIHPGDLQLIAAKYSATNEAIPDGRVPGSEAVGLIEEVGPGSRSDAAIEVGTRVAFRTQSAWQDSLIVDEQSLLELPDDISDEVATQLLVNVVTARHVLRKGMAGLSERPSRLVLTAGAASVGKIITVEALRDNLEIVRLVRSPASAERLGALLPGGAILDTEADGWQDAVREAAGGDLTLVIDGVGGPMVAAAGQLLKEGGLMIAFGLLDGGPADLTMFVPKGLTLTGVTIGSWEADTTAEDQAADYSAAIAIARSNPQIFADYQLFGLEDLADAVEAVGRPGKNGNVLLSF